MLKEHVKLSGREGMKMILEGCDKGTDRLQGPANVAAWAAARKSCSMLYSGLPVVIWTLRTFPPHFSLRPSHDLVRRQIAILCRMPFFRQIRVCGGQAIGFHHGESSTAGTAGTQSSPADNQCLPFMVIGYRTFPPHFLRTAGNHAFGRERAIFCRVPLLRQIGVCSRQAIGFHCLEVLTAGTPTAHVSSADNLSFPLVVVRHLTFPPDLLPAAWRNVPRGQAPVLR